MHAIDNACRYGERGKGTSFDVASCMEVEEPIVTLEGLCWSEADSGFCVGLHGASWKGFFVCLGVCSEFNFALFLEINGGPRHERPRRNRAVHAAIYGERVDPENGFSTMREIILFGFFFCRVTMFMYCGPVPSSYSFVSLFVIRVHRMRWYWGWFPCLVKRCVTPQISCPCIILL